MKKWLNYLPTIFILSIVLSLVFYSSQGSTVQMNYTQFEKIVDEVDFKKSSMTISSTVIQLEGTYEQNSKTVGYKVIVPRTEKNIEKLEIYSEIKNFCFTGLYNYNNIFEIQNLKKIAGHKNYYRLRLRDFRIGLKLENNTIYLMRVLHRKEIYKYFP